MNLPPVVVKKILYTTDLSENAHYAFAYAVSLANLYNASITILHVLTEVPNLDASIIGYIGESRWEEIRQSNLEEVKESLIGKKREHIAIREALDVFAESGASDGVIMDEILVKWGHPVEEIITQSKKRKCDMIVMGTHGHGVIADLMIGSTARRVLRRSDIPVLVVRLPAEKDR